jgi:SAM-dependent methyltransferase
MSLLPKRPRHLNEAAIWQDVEFGAYAADLPLWEELAAEDPGHVLELGAGSGRVTLALAERGISMIAVDRDPDLIEALRLRADGLPVTALVVDISAPDQIPACGLAIAPLQVMQLLSPEELQPALAALAEGLDRGTRLAISLVDESTLVEKGVVAEPPPDMRELDGWIYSSEPLWVQVDEEVLRMRRLRERVAPGGDMVRKVHDDILHRLTPEKLEERASAAGLRPLERREIASSSYEAGSIAVILEAP